MVANEFEFSCIKYHEKCFHPETTILSVLLKYYFLGKSTVLFVPVSRRFREVEEEAHGAYI